MHIDYRTRKQSGDETEQCRVREKTIPNYYTVRLPTLRCENSRVTV